ncbi:hypothetical protein PoB_003708900 [Plakobranchus ocellatus]|uniref:Secreted protein n=1 Tax=Plakobranchus ocellatus TaxID=259542 RepID=A0AAV4AW13_9GAST|nr:hypothetical protein PoB_003708900 [Plakobranchus ocellatus]
MTFRLILLFGLFSGVFCLLFAVTYRLLLYVCALPVSDTEWMRWCLAIDRVNCFVHAHWMKIRPILCGGGAYEI